MKNKKEIQERLNYMRYSLSTLQDKTLGRGIISALDWCLQDGENDKDKKIKELKKELNELRGKK